MSKFREMTPEEIGAEMAAELSSFHAELIKKGIPKETAAEMAIRASAPDTCKQNGFCGTTTPNK